MAIVSRFARTIAVLLSGLILLPSAPSARAGQQPTDLNTRDANSATALIRAVTQGDTGAILALIKAGVDVNARGGTDKSALCWAAFQGRLEIVRTLANAGADLNAKDAQGRSPLMLAREAGYFIVVKMLIDAGAEVNRDQLRHDLNAQSASGPWTPLVRSAAKGDIDSLHALIQLGADVNARDTSGRTVLFGSATPEVVRALIEAGADVNIRDTQGFTALMLASLAGKTEIARTLVQAGADVAVAGRNGWDALMDAAYLGHLETVRVLIGTANVNRRTRDGISALTLARWSCHREVVEALTRAGAATDPGEWKRAPRFADFAQPEVFKGPPVAVDLRSNPDAPSYRTRLREGAAKGPNFAGHFTVIAWGCGSNCESTMIVDALTGRVFGGFGDERGAEFKLNSSLVIADPANPSGSNAYPDNPTDSLPVRYYVWNGERFRLVYEEACSVRNGHQTCGCADSPE